MFKKIISNKKYSIIYADPPWYFKGNFGKVSRSKLSGYRETHREKNISMPDMWHLKESGDLEEHADTVILLNWEWFYTREDSEEAKRKYLIKVAKNRDGRTGEIECIYQPQFYKIGEQKIGEQKNGREAG